MPREEGTLQPKYCAYLNPKEIYIKNKGEEEWKDDEIPWHTCAIKEVLDGENCICMASEHYHKDQEFIQYFEEKARTCPLFTTDEKSDLVEKVTGWLEKVKKKNPS